MGQGEQRRTLGVLLKPNRRRWTMIFFVLVFSSGSFMILMSRRGTSHEKVLVQQLADLQARLQQLDLMHRARMEEAYILYQQLEKIVNAGDGNHVDASLPIISEQQLQQNVSKGLQLLMNASYVPADNPLRSPTIFNFLPHLVHNPLSLRPAFALSRYRSNVSVVMGVPTVKRHSHNYLLPTLQNLLECMSPEEASDSLIIVFVAEVDKDYVMQVAKQLEEKFRDQVDAGLIEVISPPASYYPDLDKIQQTLGDPMVRVRWRTKQNLDFAFLMMYAQPKGTFYVQLEDDIVAKQDFISTMKNYALQKTAEKSPWFVLEFCQLGFIGKLFKCAELPWLVHYLLMFYNDKPADWLLDHLIQTRVCRMDKSTKACSEAKKKLWVPYNTSLFQHIGVQSSLKGKVQKLVDKKFGNVTKFSPHSNPEADVASTIKTYKEYSLERAYRGETFFWGRQPKAGDTVTFTFKTPQHLKRYLFRCGNVDNFDDCFYNTTVEVMPESSSSSVMETNYNITSDGFFIVGKFDNLGIAKGPVDSKLNPVKVVRLNNHKDSAYWIILSEIFLEVDGNS